MLFYKIEAEIASITKEELNEKMKNYEYPRLLQTKITLLNETYEKEFLIFLASMHGGELLMGAAIHDEHCFDEKLPEIFFAVGIECRNIKTEEITISVAKSLLELSSNVGFSKGSRHLFERLDMESFCTNSGSMKYREALLPEKAQKNKLIQKAKALLCQEGLLPELERIYQPAKQFAVGHPVHYVIQSDDDEVTDKITEILLSALYANKRIKNRRYATINLNSVRFRGGMFGESYSGEYNDLYRSCEGGAISVNLSATLPKEDDVASAEMEKIENACKIALQNRNKVLTIFCLPRAAERIKSAFREYLGSMTLVELTEDAVSVAGAKAYLRQSASEHGIKADRTLYKCVKDSVETYSISELSQAFRYWYDNQLKTHCYTQYAEFETAGRHAAKKEKPRGCAHDELDKMIGLAQAKKVICQAVDYFKAQKLFHDRGIPGGRPSMHMVFSGSPGTAKTTVARLFAQIMKDNGLLSVGRLVEVGRADLVGKYVGWTAQIVKEKFNEAKGSVLFIDEAYSLVEERGGLYGDEAINTIVQEMENRRDDLVVIFAGYTDKMEEFLQRNPGLRSRIAFHVPFADYNTEDLYQILELMAGKQSFSLDKNVKDKLLPVFDMAARETDFGNGRFVRNLLERARMKQASRLLGMDVDNLGKKEITRLIAEDFEAPELKRAEVRRIGFSVM